MKPQNKYRNQKPTVHLLEKALSLKDRLFSVIALKRGAKRAKRWLIIGAIATVILAIIIACVMYAIGQANSLAVEKVTYNSTHKMLPRERALEMLGLKGTVNLATFDAPGAEAKLEKIPFIASAHIRKELPDTLHVELEERIPIAYVEMENGASSGDSTRLFVDPTGTLFPVDEQIHDLFLGVPTWYLHPQDVAKLEAGEKVTEEARRPICELIASSNRYDKTEIPAIREIFRPKAWKIILILEDGVEVMMSVESIGEQMERLARILDHARATKRAIIRTNVIPRINPTVIYDDTKK